MTTLCYAAKGGRGTTVVAWSRAVDSVGPVLLVDRDGDVPAMLGRAEPDRPGAVDLLAKPRAPTSTTCSSPSRRTARSFRPVAPTWRRPRRSLRTRAPSDGTP